ncbi:hypothetical protein [Streptomyces sp. RKND-216]|uniref:hypothetical protein n=1 Tax=Streptomyces sp. RKND-216 TaxID=2562581 RepID=UPI001B34A777|nr:hypothetical protein [Streptomyces sp. RKND-216]
MSEYQYYEFQALDRPLRREEREELRAISTRAQITATSFTNTYEWGDLRGGPRRMTERYFDAHLYVTNWGTHRLMLRLPKRALALATVKPYCLDHRVDAWTTRTHLLLDLTSDDESGEWVEGAEDSLAALIGLRDELADGDLRPLYLAWLSALAAWELEDDEEEEYQTCPEPPVPCGLDELTGPQRALADLLRVDDDLLAAAAQDSRPREAGQAHEEGTRPADRRHAPEGEGRSAAAARSRPGTRVANRTSASSSRHRTTCRRRRAPFRRPPPGHRAHPAHRTQAARQDVIVPPVEQEAAPHPRESRTTCWDPVRDWTAWWRGMSSSTSGWSGPS